jgi:hypothetical protein
MALSLVLAPVDLRGRHEDSCRSTEQVRPHRRLRRGGSPQRLRKAKCLERKSTAQFIQPNSKMRHSLYGLWRILCFYQFVQAFPFKKHTLFLEVINLAINFERRMTIA